MAMRGTVTTLLILGGVATILLLNRQPSKPDNSREPSQTSPRQVASSTPKPASSSPASAVPTRPQEHPIGEEVSRNNLQIAAVWLASVGMDGRPIAEGRSLIHLEADIRSLANNPNGFAKDEFIPYLKVRYKLIPAGGSKPEQAGEMMPMIAFDGLHYGANIEMPAAGTYQLVYEIDPPSAGGLGRHSDPVTGVAPWWQPFTVSFDWTIDSVSK